MTFPVVEGAIGYTGNTTSHSVALPASIASGELLLLFVSITAGGARTLTTPTGWAQVYNVAATSVRRYACYSKTATGSEGATVTVTASAACRMAANSMRISGWSAVHSTTPASATSTTPDPPSNAPGVGTKDFLVIAACGTRLSTQASAMPSGYTEIRNVSLRSSTNVAQATAQANVSGSSADPGTFTVASSTTWQASTILVAPPLALAVGAGSFTLSGQAVGLRQTSKLAVGAGSFSLSGQAVSLEHGRRLSVGAGSYSLAGQDVTLTYTPNDNPVLDVGAGAFTLTGQDVALRRGYPLSVGAGAFSLAGQDVSLLRDLRLSVGAGSFALSGQDVALLRSILFAVGAGAFTLGGQDVALLRGRRLSVGAGAYVLTGQDISLLVGRALQVGAGSFALTGQDVSLRQTYNPLQVGAGAFALSGQPVSLEVGRRILAEAGAFTLTGQDIAFVRDLVLAVGSGSFVLSGQDVALPRAYALAVEAGIFTLTGQDVALVYLPNVIGPITDLVQITISPDALTNITAAFAGASDTITAAPTDQESITTSRSIGNTITTSPDFRVIN